MLLSSVISFLLFSSIPSSETQRDTVFIQESGLVFRWDKTNYEDNYLTNANAAAKLSSFLEEIGFENIDSVSVEAYASPEGVYEHNMMLSRSRAREFDRAIRGRLGLGSVKVSVRPGGEAWDLLRERIAADTTMSPAAQKRVLKLLDDKSVTRDTKKWRMMHGALGATVQEGDVYHYILLNHYVYLRCLSIKIYIKEAAEPADAEPATPMQKQQQEELPQTEEPKAAEPEAAEPDTIEPAPEPEPLPTVPAAPAAKPWKPIIGLSTNLLYDATYLPHYGFTSIPSFSLEYYPAKGRYTFGADLDISHWLHPEEHRYNQIHNLTLWGRRYFNPTEDRYRGLYLLAGLNAAEYGLGWDEHGWEGEGLGLSAGIGHKWTFGHFYLDLGIAAGAFISRYDPYVWGNDPTQRYYYDYNGDPAEFKPRRMVLNWFGPTRAYFSFGIDLFNRKK